MQKEVTVQYAQSAKSFLEAAGADLLADEVRHSLAHGIAEQVASDTQTFGSDVPWFIILRHSGRICATAIRTPPHPSILSHLRGDQEPICSELVRSVHETDPAISGVVGEKEFAGCFTRHWCTAFDSIVKNVMAQRIYRLTELLEPPLSEGRMRRADMDDQELVTSWAAAFHREAAGEEPASTHRQLYGERIRQGSVYLWEREIPVSMAIRARPTRSGITIGGVYTPPAHRNRGYATSCVASACKELLQEYKFCVLYTDLSNPVSNSIYQRIGFEVYCDSAQYTYDHATG